MSEVYKGIPFQSTIFVRNLGGGYLFIYEEFLRNKCLCIYKSKSFKIFIMVCEKAFRNYQSL